MLSDSMARAATIAAFICLPLACAAQPLASAASPRVSDLGSRDPSTASAAAEQAFRGGVGAIDELMRLRGDTRPYAGQALGSKEAARLTIRSDDPAEIRSGDVITVEVAALYVISAIHRGRMNFAQSAYLTDLALPVDARRAKNTDELVERAWEAVEAWVSRVRMVGLDEVRKEGDSPLASRRIAFW